MPQPRRAHTVTRTYLSEFSKKGQVTVLRKGNAEPYSASVLNVSVKRDYYNLKNGAALDTFWEEELAEQEGEAAPLFKFYNKRNVESTENPPADQIILARWIAEQHLRVGKMRDAAPQILTLMQNFFSGGGNWKDFIANLQKFEPEIPAVISEAIVRVEDIPDALTENQIKTTHYHSMKSVEDAFVERIMAASWVIFYFKEASLLTSDSPIILFRKDGSEEIPGISNADELYVPLGRKVGLSIDFHSSEESTERNVQIEREYEIANNFNTLLATHATEWVAYHPDDNDKFDGLEIEFASYMIA